MEGNDPIWQLIVETLRRECRVQVELNPGTRLREDLGLDSLALLTLAVAAEDHFRIYLQEDAQAPPQTLGEFAELVQRRCREQLHAKPH